MKKILCLLVMLFSLQTFAEVLENVEQDDKKINIKLEKGNPSNDDTYPRSILPVTCVYTNGIVQLTLLNDIGEFTLSVTNQLTGECWSTENILTLKTSNANGIYLVQIMVEDGTYYYGSFTL